MKKHCYNLRRGFIVSDLLCLLLLVSLLGACRQEEDIQIDTPQMEEVQKFELLSVKSYNKGGRNISLDLDFNFEELRAFAYEEREDTGELNFLQVGQTEQMHIFLRKEGDDRSLTMATLTWQGRNERQLNLEKVMIQLPHGYDMNPEERWYIMGVVGGQLDQDTKTVRFGGTTATITVENKQLVDTPYTFDWKVLNITEPGKASIGTTTLQARGALLRLHFYSDLAEDYELQGLSISSNAWRAKGQFSPFAIANNAQQVGKKAKWTAQAQTNENQQSYAYTLRNNSIAIAKGSKHNSDRTLFLWVMPTEEVPTSPESSISLQVRKVGSAHIQEVSGYRQVGHRPLREGASYRLSNVLTAPLMISEVYYQFAPKGTNPDNANDQQVYSIVELYNPSATAIDLSDYALVRTAFDTNTFGYTTAGKKHVRDNPALEEAGFFPLDAVVGENPYRRGTTSKFPRSNNNVNYGGAWYKVVYGSPALKLDPGKTILIGSGGYVATGHKPSKNIELFNEAGKPASTQSIEKPYLPMAGMQADSAHRAGYMQFMIAINNSQAKSTDPNPSGRVGVLQIGNGQGVALIKASPRANGGYDYEIVDTSTPIGQNATENNAFLSKLTAAGISTDYKVAASYSIVRKKGLLARSRYQAEEWLISDTENEGIKSLGTRDYVAGLSPFKKQYTAYNRSNNPNALPFWGNTQAIAPYKTWSKLPDMGTNTFPNTERVDGRFVKVRVVSGSATREDSNDVFRKSFDGDYSSRFWGGGPLPVTLTYNFERPEILTHIVYHSWDRNQSINAYSIRVTYGDNTQHTISMPNLNSPVRTQTEIKWEGISSKPIKTVQFIVNSVGNGNGAVSFYEMEFFKQGEKYVAPPMELFSDLACTKLKAGITYEKIMKYEHQFYREIARKLYLNTYQREFRIDDYKAWTNPSYQQGLNKNQFPYGLMDNPTGMYFEEGEEVVVLVGETKGHQLKLKLVNPRHPNGYRGSVDYPLDEGFNKLRITAPGHAYVLYHVDELDVNRTAHPSIRVHFVEGSGVVNGYYDAYKREHQGRWSELLGKAKIEHFDVLGKYAQLLLRTDAFRQHVSDPKPLLDVYDQIVYEEQSMMGLLKNNKAKMFRNRLPYTRWYGGYYYAHYNHTAYGGDFVNPNSIRTGSWGIAHETGHMNQTIGFNWGGLAEISNNLHSTYIQHIIFGQNARVQNPAEKGNSTVLAQDNDRFTRSWTALFERNRPVTAESESYNSLMPFIQLHLYFGIIKGMTPTESNGHDGFLPRLYENLRAANYSNKSDGFQQVEITYYASKAVGYDLTKFFERWGFYRPVNNLKHYNTYNREFTLTVTQADINNVKQRIKDLRLPEPPDQFALEYITVLNREIYRSYKPIVTGSVLKNGQNFTLSGWKNVAAWEIRDANGKLLYTCTGGTVSQDATYTVTYPTQNHSEQRGTNVIEFPAWQDSYTLNAIDARGNKIRVNFSTMP